MIRYPVTRSALQAAAEKEKPGWLREAKGKTKAFKDAKTFNEPAKQNSWGTIKGVYMTLQHDKCAYCERKLGSKQYGKGEHDVEHYRPKNAVKDWPPKKKKQNRQYNYSFPTGGATAQGYYLLAYNIFNYATACKSCNSSLKSNYFPIAGTHVTDSADFKKLKKEKPYLIYPLGNLDADPEELITFEGILPVLKVKDASDPEYQRARVTIDFFVLDTRDDLNELRAEIILVLWLAHQVLHDPHADAERKAHAQAVIDLGQSARAPQTNCARAFLKLCDANIEQARKFKNDAQQYIHSLSSGDGQQASS
jgi:hypothetical protein